MQAMDSFTMYEMNSSILLPQKSPPKSLLVISLILQAISLPLLILSTPPNATTGNTSMLLLCVKAIATADSYALVHCRESLKSRLGHKAVQGIGTAAGVAFLLGAGCVAVSMADSERKGTFLLVLAVEEASYFLCNVLSYSLIREIRETEYSLTPQRILPFYHPDNLKFALSLQICLILEMECECGCDEDVPLEINTIPNTVVPADFNILLAEKELSPN
eukprot:TRINITY_DN7911_c0_g1_i3.p1 TRINITY_DN7911_c0_g1~~TRINITY_DN7911_c0_g1_i3.p1  ORF type:complete len:219 (+),score=30.78 TRINITY_DN7911_c0_g1_i3:60-716(+)